MPWPKFTRKREKRRCFFASFSLLSSSPFTMLPHIPFYMMIALYQISRTPKRKREKNRLKNGENELSFPQFSAFASFLSCAFSFYQSSLTIHSRFSFSFINSPSFLDAGLFQAPVLSFLFLKNSNYALCSCGNRTDLISLLSMSTFNKLILAFPQDKEGFEVTYLSQWNHRDPFKACSVEIGSVTKF